MTAGTVYLPHSGRPCKHARHYIGWAGNLDARLAAHGTARAPAHIERITPVPELGTAGTLDRIAKVPGHGPHGVPA